MNDGELHLDLETMPLVIVCGLPCSGKTRRVAQLVEHIQSHHSEKQVKVRTNCMVRLWLGACSVNHGLDLSLQVICDDFTSAESKSEIFSSAREEKTLRAALKSSTERYLNCGRSLRLHSA